MPRTIRVYVSSTYEDLKAYRQAVRERLTLLNQDLDGAATVVVVGMEGYPPSDERPIEKCVGDVDACDVYLGLMGFRYGWVSSDKQLNPDGISITEIEYRAASQKPRLLLLADETKATDLATAAGRDFDNLPREVKRLRQDWENHGMRGLFHDPDSCGQKAYDAVKNWIVRDGINPSGGIAPARRIRIGGTPPFQFIGKRFKGRAETVDKLLDKVKDPAIRVLLIEGRGGIGKSQCALALISKIHEPLQGSGTRHATPTQLAREMGITGVVYYSFRESTGSIGQSDEVRAKIAFNRDNFIMEFLAAVPEADAEEFRNWRRGTASAAEVDVFRKLLRAASEGHVLVLFDNFEDALEEQGPRQGQLKNESLGAFFDALFHAGGNVTVLITTRRPVSFASSVLAAVHQPKALDQLPLNDCRDLLRELDVEKDGRAKLRDADEQTLTKLATACDRVPRALEHAFALLLRKRSLTPAQLTAELERFEGERHKEVTDKLLTDVWASAYPEELEVGKALAILGRPATAGDVSAIMGERRGLDVPAWLDALVDCGFAALDHGNLCFSLHESDRRHVLLKIPKDDAQLLHRAAAAAARDKKCALEGLQTEEDLGPWKEEFTHFLAAGDARAAWNAISPICPQVLWERNLAAAAFTWLDKLLDVSDDGLRGDLLPAYAWLLTIFGRWRELLPVAEEMLSRIPNPKDEFSLTTALNFQAVALKGLGRTAEAEYVFRKCLELSELICGPKGVHNSPIRNNIANLFHDTNRYRDAEMFYKRALEIDRIAFGPWHVYCAATYFNLAILLLDMNRHYEAEATVYQILGIYGYEFGPTHPAVSSSVAILAASLRESNRQNEAEPLLRWVIRRSDDAGVVRHSAAASSRGNLALLLAANGCGVEAVSAAEDAIREFERTGDDAHWQCADARGDLAIALLARKHDGDAARALAEAQLAVKGLTDTFGTNNRRVAMALRTRAKAERANGRDADAVLSLRESVGIWEGLDFVPLKDTADAFDDLAEALTAVGETSEAKAARAKSAEYRARYVAQEAEAREKFPLPPVPGWVQALIDGK